ncbi:Crp/Fnr family transcriptional regulator [Chloroflexota bacterium]
MTIDIVNLKSIPYFFGLSPNELDEIINLILEKEFQKGETILFEGDSTRTLYFVGSGVVKMFKTSADGKEQILKIVHSKESFNDIPIFDDGPSPVSVQAMGPVILYGISKIDLDKILQDHPKIALNTVRVFATQMRHLISLIEGLSFGHVINRVAKILFDHAGNGSTSKPRLTQQEMAAMAGTAREVVSRSLKTLETTGAIRIERHRIIIVNREALMELTEVSY